MINKELVEKLAELNALAQAAGPSQELVEGLSEVSRQLNDALTTVNHLLATLGGTPPVTETEPPAPPAPPEPEQQPVSPGVAPMPNGPQIQSGRLHTNINER